MLGFNFVKKDENNAGLQVALLCCWKISMPKRIQKRYSYCSHPGRVLTVTRYIQLIK